MSKIQKYYQKDCPKKRNRDIKGELQNYELYIKIHIKQKVLLKDCRKREKRYQERTTKLWTKNQIKHKTDIKSER